MSKAYFKTKYQKGVFEYLKDKGIVVGPCGRFKCCYNRKEFDIFISTGEWILCNKDGSPIKTKNSVKRPNENWKKTINKYKFDRCIKECIVFSNWGFYNPKTNCFYGGEWCNDDSEAYFKYNLSKVPESKLKFKEDVLTIYNEYLDEEMKQAALQRDHFNESEYSKEGDSELFEDLKEILEEMHKNSEPYAVEIKKERENSWTDKHYDNYYTLTEEDIEAGKIRLDAYTVNRAWKINSWDDTGAAFHLLKTLPRIANEKNDLERELTALYKQVKCLCKLHNVEVD